MDELTIEQRRVGPGDALFCVLEDLQRAGRRVAGDRAALLPWLREAVELLACVPDLGQRMGWAVALAQAVALPIGPMVEEMAGVLLQQAEAVRRCRVS